MPKIGNEKRIVWEDKMYYVTEFNCRGRGFKASEAEKQEEILYETKVWKMWVLTVESFLKSEYSKIKESEFERIMTSIVPHYVKDGHSKGFCCPLTFPFLIGRCVDLLCPYLCLGFFLYHCFKIPTNFLLKLSWCNEDWLNGSSGGGGGGLLVPFMWIYCSIVPGGNSSREYYGLAVSLLGRSSGWYCFETFWWYITDTQSKNVCQNITGVWWIWFGRPSLLVF